ncbi:MAG TPA: pantoate--beta-alanine ligase [bacterium]|jgi:pantoate--beta-alanine ligase|nr:pantoate--beta-alanine ligase [bacterium]
MKLPLLVRDSAALRRHLAKAKGSVGFVPTMGALHEGHLSLVRRAQRDNGRVVVSIFVNPTQFGSRDDFSRYPRDVEADRRLLAPLGDLLVYAPDASDVYPPGFATRVKVGGSLNAVLEAVWRPGHFEGVATVVARLFALVRPDKAYFGLKDYQQFLVIKRMCADLELPVALVGCATVRESDGLAMSSRNRHLDAEARFKAAALSRALQKMAALASRGERSAQRLRRAGLAVLDRVDGLKTQYLELADPETLLPIRRLEGQAVALCACLLGGTRLIDNHPLPASLTLPRRRPGKGTRHA